jgi:hypothetical protein
MICESAPLRKYSKTTCASLASIALRRTSSGTFRPTSLSSNVEAFSEATQALGSLLLERELPGAPYVYTIRLVEGRVAFLEWTARAEHARVSDGADSFLIEDGWIVAQTIHYTWMSGEPPKPHEMSERFLRRYRVYFHHVGFTPQNRHRRATTSCPLCADCVAKPGCFLELQRISALVSCGGLC